MSDLRAVDWAPRPMLKTRVTAVDKPKYEVIDAHAHLYQKEDRERPVEAIVEAMDAAGVATIVNLDGHWGELLETQLNRYDRAYPGRFITFARLDFSSIAEPGWTDAALKQLEQSFKMGAKGLKIPKNLGLMVRDGDSGPLVRIDDPRLDPIWRRCGELAKPVMIHTGDPAAFFTPLDRYNERLLELHERPDWLFVGGDFPSRDALLEMRNRVVERHPNTVFIGAHVAGNPEDLASVRQWLARYPNLYVDIGARIQELGRQPYSARKFFIEFQDRILYGLDSYPSAQGYRTSYRFLETDDENFDAGSEFNRQGTWMIHGIYLPDDVLQKVYFKNARRLLGLLEG